MFLSFRCLIAIPLTYIIFICRDTSACSLRATNQQPRNSMDFSTVRTVSTRVQNISSTTTLKDTLQSNTEVLIVHITQFFCRLPVCF